MSSHMSDDDHQQQQPNDKDVMMVDEHHTTSSNNTSHDHQIAPAHLLPSATGDGRPAASRSGNNAAGLPQPFSPPPPHPTPHPALVAATPSSAPSTSSPSSVASRVNTFRSACLDCLISHQTHHLIPHSSKVVIFDSKLKVAHAFDGLVTHDINCFPEVDTRVLTDRGFAFLDEVEARQAGGERVLYGCYDVASRGLVYRAGEVVFDKRRHKQLVSLASHEETRRWAEDSDQYGRHARRAGAGAEGDHIEAGVSLRVTPQHLMYSQLGQLNSVNDPTSGWDEQLPTLHPAESLLSPCNCPSHVSHCAHRTAAMRLVALAQSGYAPVPVMSEHGSSDERHMRWKEVCGTLPGVQALQLSGANAWWTFLGLLGFWLGDGSLQYDASGLPESLRFGRRKGGDRTWLAHQLRATGIACKDAQPRPPASHADTYSLDITDAHWLQWFHEQFSEHLSTSDPSTLTSHQITIASPHPLLSPTASPTSPPSSPSFSSSSSHSSYSSDDDCVIHSAPHRQHSQPGQTEHRESRRADQADSTDRIDPLDSHCRLPDWLMLQLNAGEMRCVISGLVRASGSWTAGGKQILTTNVELRDQLMQALLHCGYSPCAKLAHEADPLCIVNNTHHQRLSDVEIPLSPLAHGRVACWAVAWMDLSSSTDEHSSLPTLQRQRDISLVDYDGERDGRLWCVNVQHPDHLILAQRAYRGKDGRVTKQSRPIIVGNCAPVWDSTRRKYVGLLSVSDFLDILLATANEADRTVFLSLSQQRLCDWAEFKRRRGTSISRLLCISPESTLHEAVRQLLNYRVHRLCVVQLALADTILRILTNHGILRFLRQACPQMATVSIRDLGIGVFENLLTLTYQTPISRAMEMLSMYRVSSIPVVDAHGRPVDVYSRSDIRYLAMDNAWTNLDISIEQALQPHQHGRTLPLCTRDDTLQTVAGLLIACNKHSLICVHPSTGTVEGIVSLTDIFSFILNTGPPQAESRVAALRADLERERGVVEDAQAVATAAGAGQLSEEELIRRGMASPLEGAVGAAGGIGGGGGVGSIAGGVGVGAGRRGGGRKGGPAVEDSEMGEENIPEDEDFLR